MALLVPACAAGLLALVGPDGPGAPGQRFLTDAQGRALFLYGVNDTVGAVTGSGSVAAEQRLLGTDFVRLQLAGADPASLRAAAQRVRWYARQGSYVLLVLPSPGPAGDLAWWDGFWSGDGAGGATRRAYLDAWAAVSRYFASDATVVGYDLLDRPWGGSLPGPVFEAGPLAGFYQELIGRVRQADGRHWLFVEPAAIAGRGMASALPHLDDPRPGGARLGYAPQLAPVTLERGRYQDDNAFLTDRFLASWAVQVRRTARRLGAPVVVGSWSTDVSLPEAHLYLDRVQQVLGDLLAGEAWWTAQPGPRSPWAAPGRPADFASVLATVYPRAVAGQPLAFSYDKSVSTVTLTWRDLAGVRGRTEVYLPPGDFPGPLQVELDGGDSGATSWDPSRHVLSVTVVQATGAVHQLRITPGH
ncbi:hypothetical protein [Streptacidiphilus monticola]|uniref:Glycoside hydrolase family 5 C-terminal domain-containing protein n=1 Tax=Streptacidiphilus monticola TaxID=2161674 RepID=A0ABW1G5A4_9ACTN